MSSESIYHYFKKLPEYQPSKIDIVGGFKGGDSDIDIDPKDIAAEYDPILIYGSACNNAVSNKYNKSASTVDSKLLKLFDDIDLCDKRYHTKTTSRKKGGKSEKITDFIASTSSVSSDDSEDPLPEIADDDTTYKLNDDEITNIEDFII